MSCVHIIEAKLHFSHLQGVDVAVFTPLTSLPFPTTVFVQACNRVIKAVR